MNEAGFERSANQCREKIKKLRAEYKKVKDNNNNRKTCKFFEKLDNVLGSKPATRPPVLVDSFESCVNSSSDSQKSDDRDSSSEPASNNDQSLDLSSEKSPGDGSSPVDPSSDQVEEQHDKKPPAKKKRSRDEKIEKAMGTLVSGITKALSGSDECFLQLEEKRIKLDELMLKMEDDRRKENDEREERRRRDERVKLFTLLCGNTQAAPPPMMASPYYYSHSTGSGSSTSTCDNIYGM